MFAQDVCQVCLHATHFRSQSLPVDDIPQGQTFFLGLFTFFPESLLALSVSLSENGDSVVASGLPGLRTGLWGLFPWEVSFLDWSCNASGLTFRGLCLRCGSPSEELGEFLLSLGVFLSLELGILLVVWSEGMCLVPAKMQLLSNQPHLRISRSWVGVWW